MHVYLKRFIMQDTDLYLSCKAGKMKNGKGGPRGIELQASNHGAALMSTNRCETAPPAVNAALDADQSLTRAAQIAKSVLPSHSRSACHVT